jgi:hypothetical protein
MDTKAKLINVIVVTCFFKRFIKLTWKEKRKRELTTRTSQLMSVA